ncbi:MAG: thermonuclease family protein [Candidatus Sumerlaeaceae bacterium]|nr:thermonuclease family protein [Candidatus Sumerlaeaceae bacterium]
MNFWASWETQRNLAALVVLTSIFLLSVPLRGVAARDDFAVGPSRKAAEVYERYAAKRAEGYELSPYIVTQIVPQPTPLPGAPPKRYSDLEYSRLILSTLAVPPLQPLVSREPSRTIIKTETTPEGLTRYAEAEAEVIDVLNRCVLLLETGENVRLRGVRCFSTRDPDPVIRYYVREATRKLRDLTRGQRIKIILDDPLRDLDGNILGIAYTPDGLELNRFMLEQGYGYVEPSDFYPFQDLTPFYRAETTARQAYRGIWSKEK